MLHKIKDKSSVPLLTIIWPRRASDQKGLKLLWGWNSNLSRVELIMAFQYPNGTWILTKRRVLQSVSSVRRSMFPHRSCLPTCGQSGKTLVLFNMQSCFLIRFSFLIHWNYDFEKDVSYIKKILITNLPTCRINFCILKKINSVVFVVSCVIRFVSAWWINLTQIYAHNLAIIYRSIKFYGIGPWMSLIGHLCHALYIDAWSLVTLQSALWHVLNRKPGA